MRAGQTAVVVDVALGGVLLIMGRKEPSLHLLYGLLPLAVSFLGEQLRIASAQMVLDSRGHETAAEVGQLPEDEQRVVVLTIVQRELGVMVLAAIVMVALLARAAGTARLTTCPPHDRRRSGHAAWSTALKFAPGITTASGSRALGRRQTPAPGSP